MHIGVMMLLICILAVFVVMILVCNISFLKKVLSSFGQEFFCKDCIHCIKEESRINLSCKNHPCKNSDAVYKVTGDRYDGKHLDCVWIRSYYGDNCGYFPKEGVEK